MKRARSLRLQVVLIASALVAVASVIVGIVSVVSLNDYLLGQLDDRLNGAAQRGADMAGGPRPPGAPQPPDRDDLVGAPGQSPGTVTAVFRDDAFVIGGWIDADGERHDLSAEQRQALSSVPAGAAPQTVDLGGDLGAYRVAARAAPDDAVVVTGLPLEPVTAATSRLGLVVVLVGLASILLAILAATLAMGRALLPLRRVASTASEVTSVPLGRGEVTLAQRVADDDIASTAEVGQVGAALNDLLDHVEQALAEREASEQAVRRFVADASHELRTPLTSIRAHAQLSERAGAELDELRGNAALIDAEGTRMSSLIDQMLMLARLDALPAMARTDVDLRMLVAEAVVAARTAGPDHSWRMELGEDPAIVSGDAADLRRVIDNLLGNARQHTPPGTTASVRIAADADGVTVTVSDDGPGLPEGVTVFDRFARGDASRSREDGGGTGLGLAIARAVVEAHGGTIEALPGEGATFVVTLPSAPGAG
ncbi:HAMP domain-containing histidine kinase [Microbacterium sp. KUDC0406]|uniref:sensor histidine kinase n=1 Tax=Microbacterium sp. KUDC0406 TaxID=2909588 RepID=UPI001F2D82D3|nr:HAMP domain-containing sensor histidine kinase [Microbacterium sp. KUDC0406]UJP09077.1 HAMP domain-containing histidine kinase [Microbacterium sp. KUDC0406]